MEKFGPCYLNLLAKRVKLVFNNIQFAASYVEMTKKPAVFKSPLDHEHQVLLIPQPHIAKEELIPPQTKVSSQTHKEHHMHAIKLWQATHNVRDN